VLGFTGKRAEDCARIALSGVLIRKSRLRRVECEMDPP